MRGSTMNKSGERKKAGRTRTQGRPRKVPPLTPCSSAWEAGLFITEADVMADAVPGDKESRAITDFTTAQALKKEN
jgi:hypothetical protein